MCPWTVRLIERLKQTYDLLQRLETQPFLDDTFKCLREQLLPLLEYAELFLVGFFRVVQDSFDACR